MFLELFLQARDRLKQRGVTAEVIMGAPVSRQDIDILDSQTDFPMPAELASFYLEMGDAFRFEPDEGHSTGLRGWESMWLADHKIHNIGFAGAIEEETARALGKKNPRTTPELLRQEAEKRKRWMPFYGFGGDGNTLCLDLVENPPTVRFYEALTWTAVPETLDFVIASSFTEFVERWAHYDFLSPSGAWTSFCWGRSGRFDWTAEHFPRIGLKPRC